MKHLLLWRAFFGNFLFLDRLLLERFYGKQRIKQPVFLVSPARSGSTTTGQLLDADPTLCGPAQFFCVFRYLSVWMFLEATVGRFVSAEFIEAKLMASIKEGPKQVPARLPNRT